MEYLEWRGGIHETVVGVIIHRMMLLERMIQIHCAPCSEFHESTTDPFDPLLANPTLEEWPLPHHFDNDWIGSRQTTHHTFVSAEMIRLLLQNCTHQESHGIS